MPQTEICFYCLAQDSEEDLQALLCMDQKPLLRRTGSGVGHQGMPLGKVLGVVALVYRFLKSARKVCVCVENLLRELDIGAWGSTEFEPRLGGFLDSDVEAALAPT